MNIWHQIKGWVAVITAFVACPCHLPITLPIILSLTAGTALGAWIADNRDLLVALLTLYFLGGLGLGFHWLTQDKQPAARPSKAGSRFVNSPRPANPARRR
jgi:hypothetical protein